jgi:peptidoglycan/xylan/chitin deacetylase (PgdA/CDA1 family)
MRVPVLIYHKIDVPTPDVKIRGAFTPPRTFARQLAYLKKRGVEFCTASTMVERYLADGQFPANTLALTFDDGWKDNYTHAFPILREHRIPATVFLVTSCIGKTIAAVTAEGEGPRQHLSEDDIREMSLHGLEFGSHTVNHKLLDRTPADEIDFEVEASKKAIEALTEKPCKVFAYPAGFCTEPAKDAVQRAGYIGAFSTVYGEVERPDPFALNRVEVLRRDRFQFRFRRKMAALLA